VDLSEWISQAQAARLRKVTRQAIGRLVENGRLSTLEIGGRFLVNRVEVERFVPLPPGRPKKRKS
jgi:excisionase family DNA binding protein